MEAGLQREAERLFGPGVDLRGAARIPAPIDDDPEGDASIGLDPMLGANEPRPPAGTPPADLKRSLSHREMRELWSHVREVDNFWLGLPEIEPGAVARLAESASRHGWEVLFLTQRPPTAGETAQLQSQRWLEAHGFELPSAFVMSGSRGKVASAFALDAVIDDRPENCLDVVTDSKARALLIWRDHPTTVPPAAAGLGIETVFSMSELLQLLQDMSDQVQKPPSLASRLRAAIDL
jgi:hypothetical protein